MAKETRAARKPAAPRTRKQKTVTTHEVIEREAIERRAYELHLEGFGDPLANWLRAERELATA